MTEDIAFVEHTGPGRTPDEWRVALAAEPPPKVSGERLAAIEMRLYRAVDAVVDGRLAEVNPESRGKKIVVSLEWRGRPPADVVHLVSDFGRALRRIPRYREALASGRFASDIVFEIQTDRSRFARMAAMPIERIRSVVSLAQTYERHLSVASMVGGFAFDSYTFGRIDHASTHIVFLSYLAVGGGAIATSHRLESRGADRQPSQRTRTILTAVTQFALGCLLSGFCVFYLRSASLWASWPYLLLLAAIFVGNEFFKKYTTRFTLSVLLYFFSLLSYAILVIPVLLAVIGTGPFILASLAALGVFLIYAYVLDRLGHERFRGVRLPIMAGVLAIAAMVNAFYFLKILPPLPLALADAGVYHTVKKDGAVYDAVYEPQSWTTYLGTPPLEHIAPGDKLYLYAAVFAPARITTTIVHRWEWFDPLKRKWLLKSRVAFTIHGGRDAGYRGYSIKSEPKPGDWRVNITTGDGRPLGRVRFAVAVGTAADTLQPVVLN
ncbi:MAG: DUF2914 domain-containing protein [Proteobacteria bacterium]|nr:DUF2914 domain-containing protein [Pseudomonadota bacterium]